MLKAQFSSEEFEQLVMQALDDLPEFFKEKLQNVELVVADWPTKAEEQAVGLKPGQLLFGLYQGIPQTKRTSQYSMVLPDKITIYRMPIEQVCRTPERIIRQVQQTVKHELAHHFGIDDDRLRELELIDWGETETVHGKVTCPLRNCCFEKIRIFLILPRSTLYN